MREEGRDEEEDESEEDDEFLEELAVSFSLSVCRWSSIYESCWTTTALRGRRRAKVRRKHCVCVCVFVCGISGTCSEISMSWRCVTLCSTCWSHTALKYVGVPAMTVYCILRPKKFVDSKKKKGKSECRTMMPANEFNFNSDMI